MPTTRALHPKGRSKWLLLCAALSCAACSSPSAGLGSAGTASAGAAAGGASVPPSGGTSDSGGSATGGDASSSAGASGAGTTPPSGGQPALPAGGFGGSGGEAPSVMGSGIIDTHTHFWDLSRNPAFSNGSSVLPADYELLATPAGITGTIVVESVWLSVSDNLWGLGLADTSPLVLGVIGRLQPGSATFAADLATLAANPRFRGLRVAAGDLNQPSMALLAERGLVAEVDVAQSAAALLALSEQAQALPDLKIVIDHAGNLPFAGMPSGELAEALRQASLAPNVFCKVSRFQEQAGATPAPTEAAAYSLALDFLLETFGEDRLLFGSNWPLSENAGALSDATKVMRSYFAAKPDAVAHKFFRANALAVYGLAPKEL